MWTSSAAAAVLDDVVDGAGVEREARSLLFDGTASRHRAVVAKKI